MNTIEDNISNKCLFKEHAFKPIGSYCGKNLLP